MVLKRTVVDNRDRHLKQPERTLLSESSEELFDSLPTISCSGETDCSSTVLHAEQFLISV